VTLTTQPPN